MLSKTFTHNGVTVTVRRADVRARLMGHFIYRHFAIEETMPEDEFILYQTFVQFMTQTTIEGDLGFPIPAVSAPKADIEAAFQAFMNLSAAFYDQYIEALREVESAPGEPETAPDNTKKNETP